MASFFRLLCATWFTGALYLLAIAGYGLYALLWTYRMMTSRKGLIVIAGAIVCATAAAVLLLPRPDTSRTVSLTVAPGQSLHSIGAALRKNRVVRSELLLRAWIRMRGYEKKIQAGDYLFFAGEGIFSASEKLLHACAHEQSITIPEGMTVEQTASIFARAAGIDSTAFVRLCADSAFISRCAIDAPSLEGYLFPDTYRLPDSVDAAEIIMRMTRQFRDKFAKVSIDSAIARRYSRRQLIALASIVEKEATLGEERGRIAAVFYNRLRRGEPLGADPTVRYIFRKFSGPLRVSELSADNPYNTRRFAGLPPGPICSPGLSAIQATATPPQTKELYFVAKWDGSGAHDFSNTLAEHERKKEVIQRLNDRRIKAMKTEVN
jgi:UPF0755 protein